jgi:uncharacterized protein YijF (DUF1287 family)
MRCVDRRTLLTLTGAALASPAAAETSGERLARAARAQVGVTHTYDAAYRTIGYPNGDVPRGVGVCADVPIRAARDGLGLDLQKLVHEDMGANFAAYPSRRVWGLTRTDRNIDHRRVLNLEVFWTRKGVRLWKARGAVLGDGFPRPLEPGDLLTWSVGTGMPHVGVVFKGGAFPRIVHNIGRGAEEITLASMREQRAVAHYRWPT